MKNQLFLALKNLKNSLRRNWMLEQPLDFTGCSSIQFYNTPPSLIHSLPLTQLVKLPVVTYYLLCSACATYKTLYHATSHQVLPTQLLPREVEDLPWVGKYFDHVLCYIAIYFPTKGITF